MTPFVLALLALFFLLGLLVRQLLYTRLCALCLSVTFTWIVLFYSYWVVGDGDPVAIGVLLGGSVVGGMYYLFSKVAEGFQVFKFPVLVTSLWIAYQLIRGISHSAWQEAFVLAGLWMAFLGVFTLYTNQAWKSLGRKLIECCKNW